MRCSDSTIRGPEHHDTGYPRGRCDSLDIVFPDGFAIDMEIVGWLKINDSRLRMTNYGYLLRIQMPEGIEPIELTEENGGLSVDNGEVRIKLTREQADSIELYDGGPRKEHPHSYQLWIMGLRETPFPYFNERRSFIIKQSRG